MYLNSRHWYLYLYLGFSTWGFYTYTYTWTLINITDMKLWCKTLSVTLLKRRVGLFCLLKVNDLYANVEAGRPSSFRLGVGTWYLELLIGTPCPLEVYNYISPILWRRRQRSSVCLYFCLSASGTPIKNINMSGKKSK